MRRSFSAHSLAALALTAGLLGTAGLVGVAGAGSATAAPASPSAPCVVPSADPNPDGIDDGIHRGPDTSPVSEEVLHELPTPATIHPQARTQARMAAPEALAASRLPAVVSIPVHVKVIRGTGKGEKGFASNARIKRTLQVLNGGFAGKQNSLAQPTRYRFYLQSVKRVTNNSWHRAALFSEADKRAKRALHTGTKRTLNLYINGGRMKGQLVLGWARFPWQAAGTPRLDSVSVNHRALPWGSATGYNRGDTVVHEVGHWLGLFHTFQGGCSEKGDMVADTAPEAVPSYGCERFRDTCPNRPGVDPIRNFMDYSFDSCMNNFSVGQSARMDAAYARYRK